jgi:hypothetical protein
VLPTINKAAQVNSTLLKSTCQWKCPSSNQQLSSALLIDQERANGVTLKQWLAQLVKTWNTLSQVQRLEASYHIYAIGLQVLSAVDTLYAYDLYHNDMHTDNIMLRRTESWIRLPLGGRWFTLDPKRCPWHVAVIDYGLVTVRQPLDQSYRVNQISEGMPPVHDLCHFFNSVHNSTHPPLPAQFYNGFDRIFSPMCRATGMSGRGALLFTDPESMESVNTAKQIYHLLTLRAIGPARPAPTPPPLTLS